MSGGTSRRPRAPRACEPSPDEEAKYARLLERLTPAPPVHEEYRLRVDGYLDLVGPALRVAPSNGLVALRLRRSELFAGREYLVAYVEDEWLRGIAPNCDAISSAMAGSGAAEGPLRHLPPLVFLPQSKRRARSNEFRSIVEHEIVHINQALLGRFPEPPAEGTAEDLLAYFVARTACEYEACSLQWVRWPTEHPAQLSVTLEHWCLARGYTQALEHILLAVVQMDVRPVEVERFLDLFASSLPDHLRRMGADDVLASWFQERLETHLAMAMQQVMTPYPAVMEHEAFRAAGRWLRPRLGIAPKAE